MSGLPPESKPARKLATGNVTHCGNASDDDNASSTNVSAGDLWTKALLPVIAPTDADHAQSAISPASPCDTTVPDGAESPHR